jgi:hypothetical protein
MLYKINKKDRLYVIREGTGFSCLGFDVCERFILKLLIYTNRTDKIPKIGTKAHYNLYCSLIKTGQEHSERYGSRCLSELTPQLISLEEHSVKVVDCYDEIREFKVGVSTGWMPAHLEIEPGEDGGGVVTGTPFKSIVDLGIATKTRK